MDKLSDKEMFSIRYYSKLESVISDLEIIKNGSIHHDLKIKKILII